MLKIIFMWGVAKGLLWDGAQTQCSGLALRTVEITRKASDAYVSSAQYIC